MRAGRESQIPILPLGPSGYLSACLLSLIAAMLAPGWRVVPVCILVLIMAAAFCRAGLDPLRRMWLWVLVSLLILPSALLGEGSGWTILGLGLSLEGLAAGLQMALRAVTVLIAVSGLAASVSVGELASLLERVGFKGLALQWELPSTCFRRCKRWRRSRFTPCAYAAVCVGTARDAAALARDHRCQHPSTRGRHCQRGRSTRLFSRTHTSAVRLGMAPWRCPTRRRTLCSDRCYAARVTVP